ncbi:DUF6177 family protein [Actinomadura violacea]|uniref:Uncharacterized protein n=1 Tax=Actinomadura violacea TaxID=2819934 RepID=A0ABS3S8C4_9ACTN|nr:DUF6177 family protein [Actinomadura violacea]MBO2465254.1 hypothetical protein [Actinomadura violacea]
MSGPHPTIDLVTDTAALVLQRREVVPLSSWLIDAIALVSEAGLPLQIVTPHTSRLTVALHSALRPPYLRWVVGHPSGFFDGLTGEPLEFNGSEFAAVVADEPAAPWAKPEAPADGMHLIVDLRVRHRAAETTRIGDAAELCYRWFTGAPPEGWGFTEPIALPWNGEQITEVCRDRAPDDTRLCHVGRGGAVGVTLVERHADGVDETVAMRVPVRPEEPEGIDFEWFVADLVGAHHLVDLRIHSRPGRRDLTVAPAWNGPGRPLGIALGPDEVWDIGAERAFTGPAGIGHRVGHSRRPAAWYPLVGDAASAWERLHALLAHLLPGEPEVVPSEPPSGATVLEEGRWRRG